MAEYYAEVTAKAGGTKKQEKIRTLLNGYHKNLISSDAIKDCVVRDIKDIVEVYNETCRGKKNYVTVTGTNEGDLLLQVHTEGSDQTSCLWFKLITLTR